MISYSQTNSKENINCTVNPCLLKTIITSAHLKAAIDLSATDGDEILGSEIKIISDVVKAPMF